VSVLKKKKKKHVTPKKKMRKSVQKPDNTTKNTAKIISKQKKYQNCQKNNHFPIITNPLFPIKKKPTPQKEQKK
jgi:hypothetical protein